MPSKLNKPDQATQHSSPSLSGIDSNQRGSTSKESSSSWNLFNIARNLDKLPSLSTSNNFLKVQTSKRTQNHSKKNKTVATASQHSPFSQDLRSILYIWVPFRALRSQSFPALRISTELKILLYLETLALWELIVVAAWISIEYQHTKSTAPPLKLSFCISSFLDTLRSCSRLTSPKNQAS